MAHSLAMFGAMVAPGESSLRLEREVECNAKKDCHHYFPFSETTQICVLLNSPPRLGNSRFTVPMKCVASPLDAIITAAIRH
jgi:hypothetical protein